MTNMSEVGCYSTVMICVIWSTGTSCEGQQTSVASMQKSLEQAEPCKCNQKGF